MGASNDRKRELVRTLPNNCMLWRVTDCSGKELSIITDSKGYELDVILRFGEKEMVDDFIRRANA